MVGDDDDDVSQRRAEEELRHPQCQRITYGVLHVALCDAALDSLFPIAAHARRQGVASVTVATTPRPSQTSHELAARPSKITVPADEPSTKHQAPSIRVPPFTHILHPNICDIDGATSSSAPLLVEGPLRTPASVPSAVPGVTIDNGTRYSAGSSARNGGGSRGARERRE
ncbi:hypothetical protein PC9H_002783 [Pleurotus ostreatus]|uniref:Uncharacterized protein n=1 Tax=Pleurotus ostreatus TaxID=5322 RepID=A0A8H7DM40_PLEOS|nr:uncharacterized protein PC9H_002783 [Pleurotus ostreatus]KAF7416039.1 hypothetical protein PC9H_002783 [Pleurotus ostreatus]